MKKIEFPNGMSEYLAELVGIHLGDGSLSLDNQYDYTVSYAGNLQKDEVFMNYINSLYFKLFNVKFNILLNHNTNSIELRLRSKLLYNFLSKILKIPSGKKNNLRIPDYIKNNKIYLTSFLRGLFDTDGCVTLQKDGKYNYLLAKISTKHKIFAYEISSSLKFLKIPSFVTTKSNKLNNKIFEGYDIVIRNKNVKSFFEIIGSKNPRNIQSFNDKGGDAAI